MSHPSQNNPLAVKSPHTLAHNATSHQQSNHGVSASKVDSRSLDERAATSWALSENATQLVTNVPSDQKQKHKTQQHVPPPSPSIETACINTFSHIYKYYEKYLQQWFKPPANVPHMKESQNPQVSRNRKVDKAAPPSSQQSSQTLAKWFQETSYFETHRHLAYINQQKYSKFQEKVVEGFLRTMHMDEELVPVIAFIVRRDPSMRLNSRMADDNRMPQESSFLDKIRNNVQHGAAFHTTDTSIHHLSQEAASALEVRLHKIFSSKKDYLQLKFQFFSWLLEELMRRFTDKLKQTGLSFVFSPRCANSEHAHFFDSMLNLLFYADERYQEVWKEHYVKHVLLLCLFSVYKKAQQHRRDQHERMDTCNDNSTTGETRNFHSVASSFFTHDHTQPEIQLLESIMANRSHTKVVASFLRTLLGTLFPEQPKSSLDKNFLLTMALVLKRLPALSSMVLPIVLAKWKAFSEVDELSRLLQENVSLADLEENEDSAAIVRKNVFLGLLLDNIEYLGESTFSLLLKLDFIQQSELADVLFFLLVEQMQLMAFRSCATSSYTQAVAPQQQQNDLPKTTLSMPTFVGLHLEQHINQMILRLDQDEKWLYLLEIVGTTSGESIAIDILSTLFEAHHLELNGGMHHFFDLLSSFEKVYAHIGQTFLEHLLWMLSVQSKNFSDATVCMLSNLHLFVKHVPTRVPHLKHVLFKDLLKNWRYLFALILLPISTQYLECRATLFQILEVLLMDSSIKLQNYLATDIVNGLLSLFFFLLEPGARKVWSEWSEAEDRASVLYFEYFCHRDTNTLQYRAFISKLISILWDQYDIWDETFGYFFELLCSRQIESRLQTSTMMSSEIFEQTNFPLHYHRDMLSVLNSYFPSTYPKLSLSRDISSGEKQRIMNEEVSSPSKRRPSETEAASNLFDKLNRVVREESAPLFMRESVSISKQHPSKLTQHNEVVERNANEIVALISRSCFYTSVHRQEKILSFANHLVSFTKRHNVPNRDQYAKMLPKKSTFDFDMYIGKIFTKFPIFYQFLRLVSTDPESFLRFVDVMCSLWVNLIGEWHSTIYFEKYNNTNRDLLIERTKLYMYCLKTAQWIPVPMVFLDEMIHVMSASEITEALCKIWEYITSHLPQLDQFEDRGVALGNTPIKIRRESRDEERKDFTEFLRKMLENHMKDESVVERHFGRLYRYVYDMERTESGSGNGSTEDDAMKDE
eukprot:CAMPEP_0117434878 /NCGR_PEP_ID=MMETSP0759-20121206/181_1 /TAXON_ID=63605 /ORGANISM="Percolomonas cosmopolitus, Strain WS" /LENGTH=1207 /DNA_ID=CAMNT_0005226385 /DNA_START=59 /DNA_END=3682 /DNA_ORIENTATION=+